MATPAKSVVPLIILAVLAMIAGCHSAGIGAYWGQNSEEGSIEDACTPRYDSDGHCYNYISIAFLDTFGKGQTPQLNLSHCNAWVGGCTYLGREITEYCQARGIKVFLSIGGPSNTYSISSREEAISLGDYLWQHFLSSEPHDGPLGPAVLDGIDFYVEHGNSLYWAYLARYLSSKSTDEKKVYLAASPQCSFPDPWLGCALIDELFDYVWVRFYNNSVCEYSGNATMLLNWWSLSASWIQAGQIFLGLPASTEAASGFIPVNTLTSDVLPTVKETANFGGLMLWSVYYDHGYSIASGLCSITNGYSDAIIKSVV